MANEDPAHVAMPKLYGAPAYARPPAPVAQSLRPLNLDELPIDAQQTDDERELARELAARPYEGPAPAEQLAPREGPAMLRGRPFRLRAITGRLRGGSPSEGQ